MSRTRALLLAGLVTGAPALFVPAADSYAQSRIGRLFSSPEQRLALDRIRHESGSPEVATPAVDRSVRASLLSPERGPPALAATLNGVVVRSDGYRLAWIDGVETAPGGAASTGVRVEVGDTPGGRIRVRLSHGATSTVLEPGQSIDVNGKVRAAYEHLSREHAKRAELPASARPRFANP